jgi:uncharacterized protein (TIRG00374 family)
MRAVRWGTTIIVVLLLASAATRLDWRAIGSTVRHSSPPLLAAATLVNLLSLAVKGVRWWVFLRRIGVRSVSMAIRSTFVGAGVNNIMVANSGEAARVLLVSREAGVSRGSVLATLALDRIFDPLCYLSLLLVAAWIVPLAAPLAHARAIAVLMLAFVLGVVAWLILRRSTDLALADAPRSWRTRLRRFRGELTGLASAGRMCTAFTLSVVVWASQLVTFHLVARASGIRLPWPGDVDALLLTNAGLILRATPANVGYFQFAYALAAAPFGVPANRAIAAALLLQVVQIIPVTVLGLIAAPHFLRPRRAST